jgi:LmbE family N-acetylglucosaminyl deacetylase
MHPDSIIAARPHFRREGNNLYFFLSERVFRTMSPAEAEVWAKLQAGAIQLRELTDVAAVQSLADAGLAEVITPVAETGSRPILVIEPHCDDAALSIGATMWKMRSEAEFHLLTMASRSNYTSAFHLHRDYFNRAAVTEMRTAEGDLFMRHLGGQYHCAGMAEATLRYDDSDWDLDFFHAHEVPVAISNNRRADGGVLQAWTARLKEFLSGRSFDEIWLPLGAGNHGDHDLARNAALLAIMEGRPSSVVRMYEDVPYGKQFEEHSLRILRALQDAGAKLTSWFQDVHDVFAKKLSLLGIFASQFKVGSIQPGVELSAGERVFERFWTLDALPREMPRDRMWYAAPEVDRASALLADFRRGAPSEKRVALFAIGAMGRWAEDLNRLVRLFPEAKFVVYAGPRVAAEFERVKDPRVDLHRLDGSSGSWVKATLREAATGHRIVVAGDALGKATALARLWPLGRKLLVSDMDHLSQALGRETA